MYKNNEHSERSVRLLLLGNLRYVFWIGIVVSIFFLPVILESLYSTERPFFPFLAGFFLLGGDFLLRLSIVSAGIKERHPVTNLIVMPSTSIPLKKVGDSSIL